MITNALLQQRNAIKCNQSSLFPCLILAMSSPLLLPPRGILLVDALDILPRSTSCQRAHAATVVAVLFGSSLPGETVDDLEIRAAATISSSLYAVTDIPTGYLTFPASPDAAVPVRCGLRDPSTEAHRASGQVCVVGGDARAIQVPRLHDASESSRCVVVAVHESRFLSADQKGDLCTNMHAALRRAGLGVSCDEFLDQKRWCVSMHVGEIRPLTDKELCAVELVAAHVKCAYTENMSLLTIVDGPRESATECDERRKGVGLAPKRITCV